MTRKDSIQPQPSVRELVASYTAHPVVKEMWSAVRGFGALRSISVDVTKRCNLRCVGCYFFAEDMDAGGEAEPEEFERFVKAEVARETNFVTVLGGEPSLVLERLRHLAKHFRLMIVTNGLRPIPLEGLEDVAIAISVWGDRATDRRLRGRDRLDVFDRAVANYRSDRRVVWYLTLPPEPPAETEDIVETCVANDHLVGFNYYGDIQGVGGDLDYRRGFEAARRFVDRMIQRYSTHIAFTRHLNQVISTGRLHGETWGYDVCASISADNPRNAARLANGKPYSPHFRAYNPDLLSTRRCCVGEDRDCATCFDTWAHMSWILLDFERHLDSFSDFVGWLSTAYMFYGAARLVEPERFRATLPLIHALQSPS
jgi:organic radical activating enzyme